MNRSRVVIVFVIALGVLISSSIAIAQGPAPTGGLAPNANLGTAFTYQGQLKQNGTPVNATCNLQFGLWDAAGGGAQVNGTTTQTVSSVSVSDGLFTASIDFGASAFNGEARWLAIAVACPAGSSYTPMTSRQALTPAPMALALPGLYTQQNGYSPNIIGGYSGNSVTPDVIGATIGGGGQTGYINRVTDFFGTVGGGFANRAGDNAGTVADRWYATVGGGSWNIASGAYATIPGGYWNNATMTYTLAAGYRANANHQGTFVWADSTDANFASTANDQFLIRANGGVGINTNTPANASFQVAKDFNGSGNYGQIEATGATNQNKRMTMGFDTSNNVGWIQASETGVAYRDLGLNPSGGNVGVGTTTPQSALQVVGNYIQFPTITGGAPPAADCNDPSEYGRAVVRTDGTTNLYVCTASGWIGK